MRMISVAKCSYRILTYVLLLLVFAMLIDGEKQRDDICRAQLDLVNLLIDMCVVVKLGATSDECRGDIEPFDLSICNDRHYKFTIDKVEQMDPRVIFSLSYCRPYCIIRVSTSNLCHFYNHTKEQFNLRNCK